MTKVANPTLSVPEGFRMAYILTCSLVERHAGIGKILQWQTLQLYPGG